MKKKKKKPNKKTVSTKGKTAPKRLPKKGIKRNVAKKSNAKKKSTVGQRTKQKTKKTKPLKKTKKSLEKTQKKEQKLQTQTKKEQQPEKAVVVTVDDLIKRAMPLVEALAHGVMGHIPPHIDRGDLISEGYIGLIEAARRFDPTKNVKFETFARTRIHGAMLDWLRSIDMLPRSARERLKAIANAEKDIAKETGGPVTPMQVAERLGVTLNEHYKNVAQLRCSFVPIDQRKTESVGGRDFYFLDLPDETNVNPAEFILTSDRIKSIRKKANELGESDGLILGLISFEGLNLKEVGYLLDFSPSTVRQMREKAWVGLASLFK